MLNISTFFCAKGSLSQAFGGGFPKRLVSTGLLLEAKSELMKGNVNKTKFLYLKLYKPHLGIAVLIHLKTPEVSLTQ